MLSKSNIKRHGNNYCFSSWQHLYIFRENLVISKQRGEHIPHWYSDDILQVLARRSYIIASFVTYSDSFLVRPRYILAHTYTYSHTYIPSTNVFYPELTRPKCFKGFVRNFHVKYSLEGNARSTVITKLLKFIWVHSRF